MSFYTYQNRETLCPIVISNFGENIFGDRNTIVMFGYLQFEYGGSIHGGPQEGEPANIYLYKSS